VEVHPRALLRRIGEEYWMRKKPCLDTRLSSPSYLYYTQLKLQKPH
jgi:hypothetical protein